jgi:hypothetical protein
LPFNFTMTFVFAEMPSPLWFKIASAVAMALSLWRCRLCHLILPCCCHCGCAPIFAI